MTENLTNPNRKPETGYEADETLRLLAELPPPAELTDRVHQRLAIERNAQGMPERRSFWSLWMPARRLQFAAAAVLMMAVAGSTWSVYHSHLQAGTQTGAGASSLPPVTHGSSPDGAGGFGSAKAERVPPTLNPIKVPAAPRKKPSASRVKPGGKRGAVQAGASQDGSVQDGSLLGSPVAEPKK